MMSTNNILSPSNGKPIIVPSQDIVLEYIIYPNLLKKKNLRVFSSVEEIEQALENKSISFILILSQFLKLSTLKEKRF